MKVELTNLSNNYLNDFKLKKAIDNGFIKETIDTTLIYLDADHKYLTESATKGDDKEIGTLTQICGEDTFTKDIILKHNEGKFNLKECVTEKKITFANPLDCTANKEINIFDYSGSTTETIQGELERLLYGSQKLKYIGNYEVNYSLNEILSFMDGVPDKSALGYFVEHILITVNTQSEEQTDPSYGKYYQYIGHDIQLSVTYVRITDTIQHSELWQPLPPSEGVGFFFTGIPSYEWKAPEFSDSNIYDLFSSDTFTNTSWEAGQLNLFRDIAISNTFPINEIIEDIFVCSGLSVISNFLGINPDGSEPTNKYYEFANNYCQEIRIAQSFDIIRESAIEDSFGKSGTIKVKDFFSEFMKPFNLLIVPDFDNDIVRIEHVSYFIGKGIDLTSVDYEFSELDLNKDKIDSETFSFAQPTPTNGFYEVKLNYENLDIYKEPNDVSYKNKTFLTDIFGCLNNKDFEGDTYKKLFFLLSTSDGAIIGLNSSFSIKNLVLSLHDINRPTKNALINGVQYQFSGYSIGFEGEVKLVSNVMQWKVLWPLMSILTDYGTYLIEEIELSQDNEMVLKIKK